VPSELLTPLLLLLCSARSGLGPRLTRSLWILLLGTSLGSGSGQHKGCMPRLVRRVIR
jgi:hypothetical protein